MFKYILLAIGGVAALAGTAYLVAAATAPAVTAPASKGDLPVKGEQFTTIAKDDSRLVAVDMASIQDEADGSVSIKFLFFNKHDDGSTSQSSGRLAFKCHSSQWRMQSFYDLDDSGKPLGPVHSADEYEQIDLNSTLAELEGVVCHSMHPTGAVL
jgi:hypothetical protein